MLVMAAAVAAADGNADFAGEHRELLAKWAAYLLRHGVDPENQLCTDDFAGHLAHNCNLSLKAIMGLAAMPGCAGMWGDREEAERFDAAAREMAASWLERAAEGDGSYRLAFDQPGTFSLKYNVVWDKLFGTGLFPAAVVEREFASYAARRTLTECRWTTGRTIQNPIGFSGRRRWRPTRSGLWRLFTRCGWPITSPPPGCP